MLNNEQAHERKTTPYHRYRLQEELFPTNEKCLFFIPNLLYYVKENLLQSERIQEINQNQKFLRKYFIAFALSKKGFLALYK